jgi:DNA-directed RNA polymerase specialized sigma24 family protein
MAHEEALSRLPLAYQEILQWIAEGRSHEQMAAELDVDPMAVESLVHLAEAKLARLADAAPCHAPGAGSPPPRRSSDAEHPTHTTD